MAFDQRLLLKALSPKIVSKALQSFDRSTTVVVGSCWAVALLMMFLAIYAVSSSASSKRAAEAALAIEPSLPKVARNPIDPHAAQILVDRLKHRFPGITFGLQNDQSLKVNSNDASKFRDWLTALSYIETIAPEYNWSLQTLCVGKCKGDVMNAALKAEKITFSAPDNDQ